MTIGVRSRVPENNYKGNGNCLLCKYTDMPVQKIATVEGVMELTYAKEALRPVFVEAIMYLCIISAMMDRHITNITILTMKKKSFVYHVRKIVNFILLFFEMDSCFAGTQELLFKHTYIDILPHCAQE